MYKLLYPEFLWLLVIPLLLRFIPKTEIQQESIYFPYAGNNTVTVKNRKTISQIILTALKHTFLYIGWIAWCITLCAPAYMPPPQQEIKEQRNILLATDISLSMDTRDWYDNEAQQSVSRWDAVKLLNKRFIDERKGDRFAHVVFGQEAYLQVPFTTEGDIIVKMQDKIRLGDAGPKTSIGNAIAVAAEHFRSDSITRKIMVLVTDGLDTQDGISPVQMAEEAAKDSIIIYTIAMGSPNDGFKNVDHRQLYDISRTTGGKSFMASSIDELKEISKEINKMEPMEYTVTKELPVEALYYYPLFISLLMFALSIGINFIIEKR